MDRSTDESHFIVCCLTNIEHPTAKNYKMAATQQNSKNKEIRKITNFIKKSMEKMGISRILPNTEHKY